MKTIDTYGPFEDILADSRPAAQHLAWRLRALIADVLPLVVEVPWPSQRVTGYGVGPKKMSEHFRYIAAHSDYVNLGFSYGAELPDPEHLLEGSGKMLRHLKIRSVEDLDRPGVRWLLEVASSHRMPRKPSTAS